MKHRKVTVGLAIAFVTATVMVMGVFAVESSTPADLKEIGVQPLPHNKVGPLFEKIQQGNRVDAEVLHAALIGPQTTLRAYAARTLADWGDESSIPHLIHALTDNSTHEGANYPDAGMATTRYWAAKSLREMTGRDFGYRWDDSQEARNTAVLRWTTWYQTVLADRLRTK